MSAPPLRKQYLDIKRRYADCILLFRIGDFYESFDDDARILARELDIVLTSKPMGRDLRVPLAGVPHHSLERHLATLIARGHRVAICEQLTDAPVKGSGRGLIERDVVRVVTPGTVLEPGLLKRNLNNYLAAYATDGRRSGIAYADVSTGDFAATEVEEKAALAELQRISPSELLVAKSFDATEEKLPGFITRRTDRSFELQNAKRALFKHFGARTLAPFGLSRLALATAAAGALVDYLDETQPAAAAQLTRLTSYQVSNYMLLDEQAVRSLELFDCAGEGRSLLDILDETRTAMGGRLLRRWLRQPLLELSEIMRRQEHVAWLLSNEAGRAEIFAALELVHDLERLTARAHAGTAGASEVLALGQSLEMIPRVKAVLQRDAKRFSTILSSLPDCEQVAKMIRAALNDELPARAEWSGIIRDGFSEELDSLRKLLRDGKNFLAEMEQRERARTGIRSLRVGYNKVFGYYIEVTRPNLRLVPDDYTRKQTLAHTERFITLELKEYESLVLNAQERLTELEASLFRRLCADIGKRREELLFASKALAHIDAVASFAHAAARRGYTRPVLVEEPLLHIEAGRHPVLEDENEDRNFVPNDLKLGGAGGREIALITGPNMSGKSTFLRQAALIALLAQTGSFVPAKRAVVGLADRIYTRIGLYDRIGSGESTFMTEMVETAHILHHATPRSLILLDELGRGTSTYDGLSVARAVLEYLHNHPQLRARTLFATHYHELTDAASLLPRVQNLRVEIEEREGELVFLYKVAEGVAEHSFGVYAAKLAGLPRPVIRRAEELLRVYESGEINEYADEEEERLLAERLNASDYAREEEEIIKALLETDPEALSPVEALMKLFELKKLALGKKRENIKAYKTA